MTWEGGSCDKTAAKKVIALQTAMTKKGRFLGRLGWHWHCQVAAPGDTNLNDATDARS